MRQDDHLSWDELLESALGDALEEATDCISVERRELQKIANEMSKVVYETERRFQDTADRLIHEHRENFRRDLTVMNNVRIRLNTMLRNAT